MSYKVQMCRYELGVRLALGAHRRDLLNLVGERSLRLVLVGSGIGLLAAFAVSRLIANVLFDVSATDPAIFIAAPLLLAAVAALATVGPARRALRTDPMVALRAE